LSDERLGFVISLHPQQYRLTDARRILELCLNSAHYGILAGAQQQMAKGFKMQRMGMMIGIRPEDIPEYKRLHADVWPEILARLSKSNITNFSIFLREPENVLFAYWEYLGSDFEADDKAIADDPKTKEWWKLCGPMQVPLETRAEGDWWTSMEEVFHLD
jgi:L-rhamnose mutarotase